MYGEFASGGMYPRPEDVERLERYAQARVLYEGNHQDSVAAQRIADKLRESRQFTQYQGYSAEGTVWLVYNLPRLIVTKFADLQVLNTPIILSDEDAIEAEFRQILHNDVPDLWARMHYAKQLQRAFGDVGLTLSVGEDNGPLDLRVVDPAKWYPVLDPADPMRVQADQIAWTVDVEEGKRTVTYLRVDVCYPDRVERRAFKLADKKAETDAGHEIREQVPVESIWPGVTPYDEADLGGLSSFVHIPNGCLRPGEIFGRPEFYDSSALIDDVNWRLASWSDANDRVANAPEVIPLEWIKQDDDGTVVPPSQYRRRYVARTNRVQDAPMPQYMQYPLDFQTLQEQFDASVLALLVRHEMAPSLLGLQFGRQKESGEAKALGMGTTEAATRRDLLQSQPKIDRALTVAARLKGLRDADIGTHWRVGLPKTQAELMQELQTKRSLGLVTRRDMLEQLYPWFTDDQIDKRIEELDAEREADAAMYDVTAFQG